MKYDDISLDNLDEFFPENFTDEEKSEAKTIFLKKISLEAHKFYKGKIQVVPKAGVYGFNWFNVWYTPGVSKISTSIRDNNLLSYETTNRGNSVAVVSDSTRVLGDGDVTPAGGMGVMEGKAFLMKYLGGIDAIPLCINSKDKKGNPQPQKIIDFVNMVSPSFGAVNLEDISQPNCYRVLDDLRENCEIPVWHDDAQGTACVILAGLINAVKLAGKTLGSIKLVMMGAGAANSTIAGICIKAGVNPKNIIMFDKDGSLNSDRKDYEENEKYYHQWELCRTTNPNKINNIEDAFKNADAVIALSKPGPDTIKPSWISMMNEKSIVFSCANPVPEIYPFAAKKAGAFIVGTGRGDFPNQVNNSIGFPGILKGTLIVRASKITDNMAIAAAKALAEFAENRGINPDNIVPKMQERDVFPFVASKVGVQAINDGVANLIKSEKEIYLEAENDIKKSLELIEMMMDNNLIKKPPISLIKETIDWTIKMIKK